MALTRKQVVFLTRLLVIISIAYMTLLTPETPAPETCIYGFIALYLLSNLLIAVLPDHYFSRPTLFHCIVVIDSLLIVLGIYLTGTGVTDLYLVFFLTVCMATLGSNFNVLMTTSIVFISVYGGLLYHQGVFQGEAAVTYSLRLPFILVVTLFLGYIIDLQARDRKKRELLERQLQDARKLESIGVLAGGVAHHLNNILMGIQGNIGMMLMDKPAAHPEFERLKEIQSYIKGASTLTRNLVGFAQGAACEMVPIYLNELVAGTSLLFCANRQDVHIQEIFSSEQPVVAADATWMQQVLMNLYMNAVDAMPEGGDLWVRTETLLLKSSEAARYQVAPGQYASVTVTDTGCGMDDDVLQRIFDPFFTTKEPGCGLGLGLSSVYGIIKSHGGVVRADSVKGQGTTVVLYLPISDEQPAPAAKEKAMSQDAVSVKKTILIIDDEEMVINACRRVLNHLAYDVVVARSGEEAIDIYKNKCQTIDLVLLDMFMPDMSGADIYDALKAIDPTIKVLLSSGFSLDDQARSILSRGGSGFIQKPYDLSGISQKLREVLDGPPG